MKNVAKLFFGTLVLLYGVYGYASGEIYRIPGRRSHVGDLSISGHGLIYVALSYAAFASILYVWAVPIRAEHTVKQKRKMKKYKEYSMFGLFLLGITLQLVGSLLG